MAVLKSAILGLAAIAFVSWYFIPQNADVPKLPETWWRPGNEKTVDNKIKPFKMNFSQEMVSDLKNRLKLTRNFTPPLNGVGWNYGISTDFLRHFLNHWTNKYNFADREAFFNQYPQFITNVQGLNIHYLHVKPKNPETKRVLPLLLLHGWPGSIAEFYKVIPLLITPRPEYDFVFEVVVPSLPGFGYSDSATIPGLGASQMAVVLKNLMRRIGFNQYYVQGGDWGAVITADMSAMFPEHVLGMHSNMCFIMRPWTLFKVALAGLFPSVVVSPENYDRMYPISLHFQRMLRATGYFHIQATTPDTVGVGLSDSPAGLAAYVIEKFGLGTNSTCIATDDGCLPGNFTFDELIDNLMMYWVPNSMITAARVYAETISKRNLALHLPSVPITVPSACLQLKYEIVYLPPYFLKDRFQNLISTTSVPFGGHFAAFEVPQVLADDVWRAIGNMEGLRKAKLQEKQP